MQRGQAFRAGAAGAVRRSRVGLEGRVLRPRLDHHRVLADARDDVPRRVPGLVRGEAADVILMPVRHHDRVEPAFSDRFDVGGDLAHLGFAPQRRGGRPEVDQNVLLGRLVEERQQETIAEADVVHANAQLSRSRRSHYHSSLGSRCESAPR